MIIREPMISEAQDNFLRILLNDAGYDTRLARSDFISCRIGRKIAYLDELTMKEASSLIVELKEDRDESQEYRGSNEEPEW